MQFLKMHIIEFSKQEMKKKTREEKTYLATVQIQIILIIVLTWLWNGKNIECVARHEIKH